MLAWKPESFLEEVKPSKMLMFEYQKVYMLIRLLCNFLVVIVMSIFMFH